MDKFKILGITMILISIALLFGALWWGFGYSYYNQLTAKWALEAKVQPTYTSVVIPSNTPKPTKTPNKPTPENTLMPTMTPTPTLTPTITPTKMRGNFRLIIPDINLDWVVGDVEGQETNENWGIPKAELDKWGVVRFPHLAYPGEVGVTALAGHRDISGSPFLYIHRLVAGDKIKIIVPDGTVIVYTVTKQTTVEPNDASVLLPENEGDKELRLLSCLIGSTKKRVIIYAIQDP